MSLQSQGQYYHTGQEGILQTVVPGFDRTLQYLLLVPTLFRGQNCHTLVALKFVLIVFGLFRLCYGFNTMSEEHFAAGKATFTPIKIT
jgi:hypothetical protein